jgi:hypothetical protein
MEATATGGSVGRWSRLALGMVMGGVVWLSVAGCVSHDVADAVNQRINDGMTTSELAVAHRVAFQQARKEDATVTARATVTGPTSSASSSALPEPCTSGRILHITLAGQLPHARDSGASPVLGQELTVDARTGRVCEAHYVTRPIVTDPTSVVLFSA